MLKDSNKNKLLVTNIFIFLDSLMEAVRRILQKLSKINLFIEPNSDRDENSQAWRDQLLTTRIYIPLLITVLVFLVLFTAFSTTTISTTVPKPSLDTYKLLEDSYGDKVSCPCQRIAVPYSSFLSIKPIHHQVSLRWLEKS